MKPKFTSVRITAETFERYQAYAAKYQGISPSALVELVLDQVADLIDQDPAKRALPRFVQVIDLAMAEAPPLVEPRAEPRAKQLPVKQPARN